MSDKKLEMESVLGVTFRDERILYRALTHPSALPVVRRDESYEELEFLGDKIIGYLLALLLRKTIPRNRYSARNYESLLTQAFGRLVSQDALGEVGEELGLFPLIRFGPGVPGILPSHSRHAVVADVFEAIVAAIHEDQGVAAAARFLERMLSPRIQAILGEADLEDPKNRLFRSIRATSEHPLTYGLIERRSPFHKKSFVCGVYHRGELLAKGEGRTRKLAELDAAERALCAVAAGHAACPP